jgi:hypothetical protein
MKLHSIFGALAVALLLIQACSDRDSSNKIRNFNLPNGGRVTVERMISVGQEGEQVTEYDSANKSMGVSWCPDHTYEDMANLFRKLRNAVVSGNQESVADVMGFPFDLNNGGKTVAINNRAEFKRRYDEIFTPAVVKRLAQASPQAVFCQADGVGFANGTVWTRNWKTIDVVNQ